MDIRKDRGGVALKTSTLWGWIGSVALAATLLLAGGFGWAVFTVVQPSPSGSEPPAIGKEAQPPGSLAIHDKLNIVALGDSLTRGTGDETGRGYVGYTQNKLAERYKKPVFILANHAVNGYKSEQLLSDLKNKTGISDALKQAHVILFTIGGNDLFSFGTEPDLNKIRANVKPTLNRLEQIAKLIHEANPNAKVIYLGLYNPFSDMPELRPLSLEAAEWNRQAFALIHAYPNMTMVPTYDLFERNVALYLSSDHYHPNGLGYERIAERIAQVLE